MRTAVLQITARFNRERERFPLLIPVLAMISAALTVWHLGLLFLIPLFLLLAVLLLTACSPGMKRYTLLAAALVLITAVHIGSLKADMLRKGTEWNGAIHTLEGVLKRDPELTSSGRLSLRIRSDLGNVLLWYDPADLPAGLTLRYGDLVSVRVQLSLPPEPRNPGSFDYRSYLMSQKIPLTANSLTGQPLSLLDRDQGFAVLRAAYALRRSFASSLQDILGDKAALPQAMLLGLNDVVPEPVNAAYSKLGLSHILVTSGSHVAMLIGMLDLLLSSLKLKPGNRRAVGLVFLLYYSLMTAFAPAVIRAAATRGFATVQGIRQKLTSGFQNLLAATFLIVLFQPHFILQIGFQLSLVMTVLIITCSPAPGEQGGFSAMLKMQGTAMILAVPINMRLNGGFHLLSVPLNLTVNPLLETVSLLSLPLILLDRISFLEPIAAFTAMLARGGLAAAELLVEGAMRMEGLFLRPNYRSMAVILPASLFLIIILGGRSQRLASRMRPPVSRRRTQTAVIGALSLLAVLSVSEVVRYTSLGTFSLTVLDIGQGDSLILRVRGYGVVMIDTGKPGQLPYIWEGYRRARRLPARMSLFLTHLDADHHGEAAWFIRQRYANLLGLSTSERDYYLSLPESDDSRIRYFDQVAVYRILCSEYKIPLVWLSGEEETHVAADTSFRVLTSGAVSDGNNASLVLLVSHRDTKTLLTGDAEIERETIFLAEDGIEAIDVLKVGHHGSKNGTGERLLKQTTPGIALISAGVKNTYNHPSPEVLNRLQAAGSNVYRTDTSGALELSYKTDRITVRTHLDLEVPVIQSNAHLYEGGVPVGQSKKGQ